MYASSLIQSLPLFVYNFCHSRKRILKEILGTILNRQMFC